MVNIPLINTKIFESIKDCLGKKSVVFEWGFGYSTIYLSNIVGKIISIEHNKEWYNKIKEEIKNLNIKNIELNLLLPDTNMGERYLEYLSNNGDKTLLGMNFYNYVSYIDTFDILFDIIIIDGRCRNKCLDKAIRMIKSGGFLVFDDYERERYDVSLCKLKDDDDFVLYKVIEHTRIYEKK